MKGSKWIGVAIVLTVLMMLPLGSAFAADDVKLVYGSTQGKNHTFSKADIAWMDYVKRESNGRIQVTPYWGSTLLSRRENVKELINGVADLGYVSPRTGFPMMLGTFGFYYGAKDWQIVYRIDQDLRKDFPQLDKEWSSKLKIMAYSVASNYQLISTKPVRSAADFKGLMVKATGAYSEIIKELGGQGVFTPMGETYMALQKGTIDACLAPYSTIVAFKFDEVAKYVTVVDLTSGVRVSRAMNLDKYNKMPADIKKILDGSVDKWSKWDNEWRAMDDVAGIERAKKGGMEIITLPKAELAKVYAAADKAMLKEAQKLDGQGLPGTKYFEAVRASVAKLAK